jgi:RNA polymerase sigma-70 factor (ECF subfamily)
MSDVLALAMAAGPHNPNAFLTLVPGRQVDTSRTTGAGEDWSTLMVLAQDGDRRAYRELLEGITPYVRNLAARCFREPTNIDDAVQDVLLTIHLVRHTYDPQRPFGPWLAAIANRRIIDRLRRETRQKAREVVLTANHETFADPAANHSAGTFDEATLAQAIGRLPPDQRRAITMLKLNEMSLKEAAAASGRSIVALKVATHRAVKNLRRLLKQESERQ